MTEVTPKNPTPQDDAAHIQAMANKGAQAVTGEPAPTTPDPEAASQEAPKAGEADPKPETPEAASQEAPKAGEADPKPETPEATDEAANDAVEEAGLNMADLEAKVSEKGELDEADYEALAKVGIAKEMVDMYIAGQRALGEQMVSRMAEAVGGQDTLDAMIEWASTGLTPEEVTAFNDTIDKGNEAAVKMALQGLQMKYNQQGNNTPNLLGGKRVAPTSDVFRSTAELTKAMGDPRYQNDPAYRADVEAKLARSSIF